MASRSELLIASKESKDFFFEQFYMVPDVAAGGLVPLALRDYQRAILADIEVHKNIIGLKARQIGWTTIAVANALHDALFNEWRPWKFISRNEKAAQDMVAKATLAYYRLPPWMRNELPKLISETQSGLGFSNGSRIESEPATGSSFRGDAVYGLLMDECAFMEYAEEIWGAAEAGVYGPRMLFSTANGMGNFFHEIWLDSLQPDSAWHGIFYPWDVVPARDQDWYGIKKKEYRGRMWQFFQEYPSNSEEAFAKSGRVAFAQDIIKPNFQPLPPVERFEWVMSGEPRRIGLEEDVDVALDIWVPPTIHRDEFLRPIWKPNYVVGVDVAEGLDHGDYTAITVFDANTNEEVAASKAHIPVSYLNEYLNWLGRYYYDALMVVERNAAGVLPIDRLARDDWYPRMYRMDRFAARSGGDRTPEYGWRTMVNTKRKMVDDFVYALMEGHVLLHDPTFAIEAQTFVSDGKGGYAASSNNHDDTVMSKLIAWQGVLDSAKYEIVWRDTVLTPPTHDEIDALLFSSKEVSNADRLEVPLGAPEREAVVKTVFLLEENFVKNKLNTK